MMIPEFFAGHVPPFTLYGDGTVLFVSTDPNNVPEPNAPWVGQPLRTAKLSEAQIQDCCCSPCVTRPRQRPRAVRQPDGGGRREHDLRDPRRRRLQDRDRAALGMEEEPGPDTAVKTALAGLADRLRDFDQGGR